VLKVTLVAVHDDVEQPGLMLDPAITDTVDAPTANERTNDAVPGEGLWLWYIVSSNRDIAVVTADVRDDSGRVQLDRINAVGLCHQQLRDASEIQDELWCVDW
jgi:hypothetical protein